MCFKKVGRKVSKKVGRRFEKLERRLASKMGIDTDDLQEYWKLKKVKGRSATFVDGNGEKKKVTKLSRGDVALLHIAKPLRFFDPSYQ